MIDIVACLKIVDFVQYDSLSACRRRLDFGKEIWQDTPACYPFRFFFCPYLKEEARECNTILAYHNGTRNSVLLSSRFLMQSLEARLQLACHKTWAKIKLMKYFKPFLNHFNSTHLPLGQLLRCGAFDAQEMKFTDMILCAENDVDLPCHRVVLAKRSEVFDRMLSSDTWQSDLIGTGCLGTVDGVVCPQVAGMFFDNATN